MSVDKKELRSTLIYSLKYWVYQECDIPMNEIKVDKVFADYGLDSLMMYELEQYLKDTLANYNFSNYDPESLDISPVVMYSYPTIEKLTDYIVELVSAAPLA